jgi:hypothetical protein
MFSGGGRLVIDGGAAMNGDSMSEPEFEHGGATDWKPGPGSQKYQAARAAEAARTASCVKRCWINHSTILMSWLKDNTLLQTNGSWK